jgi:hypothetical protein
MRVLTILTIGLVAVLNACKSNSHATQAVRPVHAPTAGLRPAAINHVVFFKLKDPSESAALINDCDRMLAVIPGVDSYFCGTPLDTGRGAIVDNNFDVGLYLGFATQEDLAAYVSHLNHVTVVRQWQTQLEWLRVHDVIDQTP